MFNLIPTVIKKLWEKWNLRFFILFSLSLQTILILCAPFRKRTPNIWIIFIVWTSYLLADWAANFAIGLISNRQGNNPGSDYPRDLLAFWAPFLLLHLGGPDTITAFALEDNTLWKRHLLGLIFQVIATLYVFSESFPKNKLWLPTCLLFLAGIIKYAERTRGLYGASLDNFKEAMCLDVVSKSKLNQMGSKTTLQQNEGRGHYHGWMIFNFGYVINKTISSKFREAITTIRESYIETKCRNRICRDSPAMDEHRSCELVLRHQKNSEKSTNFTDFSSRVDEQLS